MGALAGRVAVITGGSRGIGAATGIALAQAGAEVVLAYFRNKDLAEAARQSILKAGGRAQIEALDATDPVQVRSFAERVRSRFARIDLLFNNAGDLVQRAALEEQTVALYRQVMDLNVLSTLLVTQALLPALVKGSVIVNMSSLAAQNGGGPGASLYSASKGAVASLTRAWARELGSRGIRVFALSPGAVETDFHRRHSTPASLEGIRAGTAVGKLGEAADVARAVLFLAGEGAGYMTGNILDLNGGAYFS